MKGIHPIHTVLSMDSESKRYEIPFLHPTDSDNFVGFICDGCNGMFPAEPPTMLGYCNEYFTPVDWLFGVGKSIWRKVEYCLQCAGARR